MFAALHPAAPTARGEAEVSPIGAPILQRMILMQSKSFAMDYAEQRGIDGRALVVVDIAAPVERKVVSILVFGTNRGIVKPPKAYPPRFMRGYRWTISPKTIYDARERSLVEGDPVVLRRPFDIFVVQADGTAVVDTNRMEGPSTWGGGKVIPSMSVVPINAHREGHHGWNEGDSLNDGSSFGTPPKEIHYDIRAADDKLFELYLTADGSLERWSYTEDRRWWLAKRFPVKINGPFLICGGGHAAVAERDGYWCFISPLEDEEPRVQVIVAKQQDVALLVIEDVFAGTSYFEHAGVVYDENGTPAHAFPASVEGPARFEALAEFVWSQREK